MTTVAEFLDKVRSSTTLRFAEYVEINHIDRDFSYSTDWRNIAFAAKMRHVQLPRKQPAGD